LGEGHGQRRHTFEVDLATCNQCHGEGMHFPVTEAGATGTADVMTTAYAPDIEEACVMEEGAVIEDPAPQPAQPLNYLLVAAVGMGFGAAVTPVAENWYRRFSAKD
jgi:anti-sigma factor RsiW